jgi:hypothetical protein
VASRPAPDLVPGTISKFCSTLTGNSATAELRCLYHEVGSELPVELVEALEPVVDTIASLTQKIEDYKIRSAVVRSR